MAVADQSSSMEDDIYKMLVCETHLGTKNISFSMIPYVYKRNAELIHIINLRKTWEKVRVAARVIVAIENPADIIVVSARPYGSRATLKFCQFVGAVCVAGRWTPGTLTNQITQRFMEPRLLIVTDPRMDSQAVRESAYANIPVIALCDTDSPLQHIDIAIPCNNKGKKSIALMYWMLSREILYLRNKMPRSQAWDVFPDVFFWRDPEEVDEKQAPEAPHQAAPQRIPEDFVPTVAPPVAPTADWERPVAATVEPTEQQWGAIPVEEDAGGW
eukprot:Platyproteum_vivax@DN2429_c0_g1_i1.p1